MIDERTSTSKTYQPSTSTSPTAPAPAAPVAPTATDQLTAGEQGVYNTVMGILSQWGLEALAPDILKYAQLNYDGDTTLYLIRQSPTYKDRFAGNEARMKKGLAPLSEAEYLSLERGYKAAARAYNLPDNFADQSHAAELIGSDVSANEFAQRAAYAFKYTQASNPEARAALANYYGITDSQITASFLDPTRAQAVLDRQVAAVDLGAAALRQGITDVNRSRAESFVDQGISAQQADRGFADTSMALGLGQLDIAKRFGSDLSQQDLENEFVGGLASAARKRAKVNEQEQALFAANEGAGARGFSQDTLGSY